MLFRQLEYFVALARERHFARAAAACYVSQPALSEAIRKLERELGVPLVNRGHMFEGLTPEGERLVAWARRILADHDALIQEVAAMRSGLDGRLRVATVPAASTTAALLIEPFCSAHPLVTVSLETGLATSEIIRRLARFEIDVGILYREHDQAPGGGVPDNADVQGTAANRLHTLHLYTEQHVLVAGRHLVPDSVDRLAWRELTDLPVCALNPSMRGRQLIDEALARHGTRLRPETETDSISSIYALASTGRWAGIVPHPWIHPFALPLDTRIIPLVQPTVETEVVLATSPSEPASVLGAAFVKTAGTMALDKLFTSAVPLLADSATPLAASPRSLGEARPA